MSIITDKITTTILGMWISITDVVAHLDASPLIQNIKDTYEATTHTIYHHSPPVNAVRFNMMQFSMIQYDAFQVWYRGPTDTETG